MSIALVMSRFQESVNISFPKKKEDTTLNREKLSPQTLLYEALNFFLKNRNFSLQCRNCWAGADLSRQV